MDEYWQQSGETVTIQQSYQPPQQHSSHQQDEEFDFSTTQNNYDSTAISHSYGSMEPAQFVSQSQSLQEDQITRQIRQEQERINEMLQEKANQEYELKQKRKQEGRRWMEKFFAKKQQQTSQRKQENLRHQQQIIHDIKNAQTSQGWTRVAKSVDLKQSEYKGSKEINRMREAILHKKEDESSA